MTRPNLGGGFLSGDPAQVARWICTADRNTLRRVADRLRDKARDGRTPTRDDASKWLNTDPGRDVVPQDRPPLVGARDHETVASRLQFQGRMLHVPYFRGTAYNVEVPAATWHRVSFTAYEDPFEMASSAGFRVNQDGLWTFLVRTDWSYDPDNDTTGAARATRLEVDGADVAIRDYLDDDADTVKDHFNTFVWTDQVRAGSLITVSIRCEGVAAHYTMLANVYIRAYLVRCAEGAWDHYAFPPPEPPPSMDDKKPTQRPCRGTTIHNPDKRKPVTYSSYDPGLKINAWWPNGTPMIVHGDGVVYYSTDGQTVHSVPSGVWAGFEIPEVMNPFL
mgnify:FL=1